MASTALQSRLGSVVGGRYLVLAVLGQGGMGVLYTAEHTLTKRRVALKLLKLEEELEAAERQQLQQRFINEARAAAAVPHPNVVDVLDMGADEDGSPFLAMELLEGISLDRLLGERGKLAPDHALGLLLPIIGALSTLHDAGIVHRDVKPSNIFLSQMARGRVEPKLLDFGLAHSLSDLRLTRSGMVMGTPLYMAPEHAGGDDVGPQADVWSMGIVLYECVTGELPFKGREKAAVAAQVLAGQLRPLSRVNPELPQAFAFAIERALRRDLSFRYASMRELAQGLVIAARACGMAIPEDPDPVGLPEYQVWLEDREGVTTQNVVPKAPPSDATPALGARNELASTPPTPMPRERTGGMRTVFLWATLGLVLLALGFYAVSTRTRAPAAAPAREGPTVPRDTLPSRPAAQGAAPDEVRAPVQPTLPLAEPQTPDAAAPRGSEPTAVPATPGRTPRLRRAQRPAASPEPIQSGHEVEPAAPVTPPKPAPNPFQVEADWR